MFTISTGHLKRPSLPNERCLASGTAMLYLCCLGACIVEEGWGDYLSRGDTLCLLVFWGYLGDWRANLRSITLAIVGDLFMLFTFSFFWSTKVERSKFFIGVAFKGKMLYILEPLGMLWNRVASDLDILFISLRLGYLLLLNLDRLCWVVNV